MIYSCEYRSDRDTQWTTRAELARKIRRRVYLSGRFTLRAGMSVTEYFDKYQFESTRALLPKYHDDVVSGHRLAHSVREEGCEDVRDSENMC